MSEVKTMDIIIDRGPFGGSIKCKVTLKRGFSETNKYLVLFKDKSGGYGKYFSSLVEALSHFNSFNKYREVKHAL